MQYTQLGKTDLKVSRICFGCWQLSPRFWGEVDLREWTAALRAAEETGVNFIDTADAYGDGFAETSLGDFFAAEGCRDRFVLATKFYWSFETGKRYPDTSYDYILRECEASLKRLKTDVIDLYQIHAWDPLTRPDEVAAALNRLKKEGKVRWFGVSNLNVEQMRAYQRHFDVACLQPLYNMLDRKVEAEELPFCQSERIGVITYSTLCRGLLSGKYSKDQTFNDARGNNPRFQGERFARILDRLEQTKPIAEKYGLTTPQLAVRWALTNPAVTSAIVGVKKPEHITTIAPAADGVLSIADWHALAEMVHDG